MGVGQRLAAARLAKGLSVADVAAVTRLRSSVIQAIEASRWDLLDEPVFVRAQLKSYAQVVDVDVDEILEEFTQSIGMVPEIAEALDQRAISKLDIFSHAGTEPLPARRSYTLPLVIASLVVLCALLAWVKLGPGASSLSNLPLLPSSSPTESQTPTVEPTPTPTAVDPAEVTVVMKATGPCWVSVTAASGESLMQNTLQAGSEYTFVDPNQITIRLGNAGAVTLTVNGVELGYLGEDGQVLDLSYGLGDPTATG